MDEKAQQFLKLYNDLDLKLQNHYNDFDRNHSQIMRYSSELSKSPYVSVSERGRKLNLIRQIRNLLIHDLDMNNDGLIEINQDLIDILASEIKHLTLPPDAYKICTPMSKIIKANFNDHIIDVFSKMVDSGYMQLPVIDEQGKLFGVLSPNALLAYIVSLNDLETPRTIIEMQEFLPIDKHICEKYAFIARNASVEAVVELFLKYYNIAKKLVMVFVTENGKEDEKILGIITSYDIVNLLN